MKAVVHPCIHSTNQYSRLTDFDGRKSNTKPDQDKSWSIWQDFYQWSQPSRRGGWGGEGCEVQQGAAAVFLRLFPALALLELTPESKGLGWGWGWGCYRGVGLVGERSGVLHWAWCWLQWQDSPAQTTGQLPKGHLFFVFRSEGRFCKVEVDKDVSKPIHLNIWTWKSDLPPKTVGGLHSVKL